MKLDYKPTAKERVYYRFAGDAILDLEWAIRHPIALQMELPHGWHQICKYPSKAKKTITTRVDEDVVKFFKALGPGYQEKINKVLVAFMNARLAKIVDGPESIDHIVDGVMEDERGEARPQLGETERMQERYAAYKTERAGKDDTEN